MVRHAGIGVLAERRTSCPLASSGLGGKPNKAVPIGFRYGLRQAVIQNQNKQVSNPARQRLLLTKCPMKKPPKYKQNQLLEVLWTDAESNVDWEAKDEIEKPTKADFKTIGYFTRTDKKYLYLSWAVGINGNEQRSRDAIPLGCIEKITRKK